MLKNKLVLWLTNNKGIIEIILVLITIATLVIIRSGIAGGEGLLMIVMSVLAGFYFISAYFVIQLKELYGIILLKFTGIASSVCIIGILFRILRMPGALQMLSIGFVTLSIAAAGLILFFIRSQNRTYFPYLIRSLILGGLTGWMFLNTQSQME
jgi:hypothetical protein